MRITGLTIVVLALIQGPGCTSKKDGEGKTDARITLRSGNVVEFKLANSHGIEVTTAKTSDWQPRICVDGRVVPNPHATLEMRAPFAGIVQIDTAPFRVGAQVQAHRTMALFEARVSPLEKLDLRAKSADAEARHKGAEDVVKIRRERLDRLERLDAGAISRGDLDAAQVQLAEARMLKEVTFAQWNLWKQALESVGKKSIIVPIQAPITGEIAEIGAQPGANVEAGQLLVRLIDFRRVLVRLDFPMENLDAQPPPDIEVEALSSAHERPVRWRASLRGPAPQIEIGLQKISYLYEIVPSDSATALSSPSWRPGLYVKTALPELGKSPQPAAAIPASAVLVHQGRQLVYVQLTPGHFERRVIELLGRADDTLFVTGVRGGEAVVSKHAQVLLSEEFRGDFDDD